MKVEFENFGNPNGDFFTRVKNPELFVDPKDPQRRLFRPEFEREVFKWKMKKFFTNLFVAVLVFIAVHQVTASALVH